MTKAREVLHLASKYFDTYSFAGAIQHVCESAKDHDFPYPDGVQESAVEALDEARIASGLMRPDKYRNAREEIDAAKAAGHDLVALIAERLRG